MKEDESPTEDSGGIPDPWECHRSHSQQQFWSKFPTQDLSWTVLCALLGFTFLRWGCQLHLVAHVPGTFSKEGRD